MKKVFIVAIVILFLLLIIILWVIKKPEVKPVSLYEQAKTQCMQQVQDEIYYIRWLVEKDQNLCKKIMTNATRELCEARHTKNTGYCEQNDVEKEFGKEFCLALVSEDSARCNNDPWCLAELTGSAEACNSINTTIEREDCVHFANRDLSFYNEQAQNWCTGTNVQVS